MRRTVRYPATLMATVLLASSVLATGCGKDKGLVVQADSPWYDLRKVTIGEQYKNDDSIAYFSMYYIGRIDDFLLFSSFGNYKERQDSSNYIEDLFANSFNHIDVYDLDGTLVSSIDQIEFLQDEELIDMSDEYACFNWETYIEDDKLVYEYDGMRYQFDPSTGEQIGNEPVTDTDVEGESYVSYELGDYIVDIYMGYEAGSYVFDIKSPDGSDTRADIQTDEFSYIDNILYLGEGKAVFNVTAGGYAPDIFYSLDLMTGQIEEYEGET
ncbi:MAG: hypothetical protein K5745_00375, partial [Saccharofermentans sp.]|nr:hypothetical protein [Saccharofermentans sp.]